MKERVADEQDSNMARTTWTGQVGGAGSRLEICVKCPHGFVFSFRLTQCSLVQMLSSEAVNSEYKWVEDNVSNCHRHWPLGGLVIKNVKRLKWLYFNPIISKALRQAQQEEACEQDSHTPCPLEANLFCTYCLQLVTAPAFTLKTVSSAQLLGRDPQLVKQSRAHTRHV